ncbi:hypothetical protein OSTOST_13577, partial [Ostertagia ostertagi]
MTTIQTTDLLYSALAEGERRGINWKALDHGVNTQPHTYISCGVSTQPVSYRTQSIETDIHDVINRSVETDDAMLLEKSMETSRSECVDAANDALSWAEKVRRDMMTSPIVRRLLFKTIRTNNHSGSSEETHSNTDHSQQTSIVIDRLASAIDQEQQTSSYSNVDYAQQTSMIIDRPMSAIDREQQTSSYSNADLSQQTSIVIDSSAIDREQQTSCSIDRPPPVLDDVATQSSPEVIDKMTAPIVVLPLLGRSMQTSQDEAMNRLISTDFHRTTQRSHGSKAAWWSSPQPLGPMK